MRQVTVRIGLILIGMVLVACVDGSETTFSTSTGPGTTEASTTTSLPEASTTTTAATTTTSTASTATTGAEAEATAEIRVESDTVEGGGLIEVGLGDEVRIEVTADTVDEAHLHGYDITTDVGPGTTGIIEFVADIPGVFELELENSGVELGRVQVSP